MPNGLQNMLPKAMAASTPSECERTRPEFDGVIRDETIGELKALMLKYSDAKV